MRLLQIDFNPRSPHRERHEFSKLFAQHEKFQSTLPSQGATPRSCLLTFWIRNFNPRSPHRERPDRRRYIVPVSNFNPRSPHRERLIRRNKLPELVIFQSTLPSQGATANIHIKFLCDLLFSTLSSKNSFTLSRFPQTIT